MTVRVAPFIPSTAGITVPSEIVRLAMKSLVPSPGLANTGDLVVAAHGTPNMTVDIAAGGVWIAGTSVATQGSYFLYNDASLSVAIAAADPTNPRIDLIVAVIRDNAEDASGSTDARIIAVTGTPAGSPVAPSAPASSIVLAQVAVAALTTTIVSGNITDKRGATCGDGIVVCTATTRPTGRTGLLAYETNTGNVIIYQGSAWVVLGYGFQDAWTAFTPTFANVTTGTGSAAYKLVGKTLFVRCRITGGTVTANGNISVTIPGGNSVPELQAISAVNPSGGVAMGQAFGAIFALTKDATGNPWTIGAGVNGTFLNAAIEVS